MRAKLGLVASALVVGALPILAQDSEGPVPDDSMMKADVPHIVLAPPPGTEPAEPPPEPPPEDPAEVEALFFDTFFKTMDADGDGQISPDEMRAWVVSMHMPPPGGEEAPPPPPGGEEPPPPGGEDLGLSEGDPGVEGLPYPPPCDEGVRESELSPQAEGVACGGHEGNLIFRTVCNVDPYNTNAISLPEGRAADCFGIEAIKGHDLVFEIIRESDGAPMFHTSWGKPAFDTLVLVGEPGGSVYQIKLLGAAEPDAALTLKFLDHPVGP